MVDGIVGEMEESTRKLFARNWEGFGLEDLKRGGKKRRMQEGTGRGDSGLEENFLSCTIISDDGGGINIILAFFFNQSKGTFRF